MSRGGLEPPTQGFSVLCSNHLSYLDFFICMFFASLRNGQSGVKGFEPLNVGSKFRCLTTWRHPKKVVCGVQVEKHLSFIYLLLDLNEWQSAYEADALTDWAKQAEKGKEFHYSKKSGGRNRTYNLQIMSLTRTPYLFSTKMSQSSRRFPYGYLVTTSLQLFKWS